MVVLRRMAFIEEAPMPPMIHHPMNTASKARCLTMLAAVALATGCEQSGLDKVIVAGEVAFAGRPVENGEIRFYPIQGTAGPVSGAPIVDGRFEAKAKGGVPVGSHEVQIRGFRPAQATTDSTTGVKLSGGALGAPEQYIPAKYNDSSALVVTVESDSGALTRNFNLEP